MIITLQAAQAIDSSITQDMLDSYETAIRQLTHNNFQVTVVRAWEVTVDGDTVTFKRDDLTAAIKVNDTVELSNTAANDGLYTVKVKAGATLTLDRPPRLPGTFSDAILTWVDYPADVKEGVRKLIAYDKKMAAKLGVKSETISRLSVTYYDANSSESVSGYPANLMSFIKKYTKMHWG